MSSGTAEIERKESCSWTATATATAKSYFETNVLARVNCVRTSNACNFCGTSKEKKAIQRRNWAEKSDTLKWKRKYLGSVTQSLHNINHIWRIFDRIMLQCSNDPYIVIRRDTKAMLRCCHRVTYLQQHWFRQIQSAPDQCNHLATILDLRQRFFHQNAIKSIVNNSYSESAPSFTGRLPHIEAGLVGCFNIWNYCQFYGNNFKLFTFAFPLMYKHIHRNPCEQWKTTTRASIPISFSLSLSSCCLRSRWLFFPIRLCVCVCAEICHSKRFICCFAWSFSLLFRSLLDYSPHLS